MEDRTRDHRSGFSRREFLWTTAASSGLLFVSAVRGGSAAPARIDEPLIEVAEDGFPHPILKAPESPEDWPAWREALGRFRSEARQKLKYSDALYQREDFTWVLSCFSCCFLMLNDERFMDARHGRYRVEQFLEAETKEFGGFDAVVLWQAYPRLGLDDRTQFDFYRDMPGGIAGMRDVVRRFQERGVKVFLSYNPWDRGTRLGGEDHFDSLTKLIGDLEADGVFLDTLDKAGAGLRQRLDAVRQGVALESELALPLQNVGDHHLSWMQWWSDDDRRAPGVLRNKWFERRHMQHEIRRWNQDHTAELHTAWMNGSGMLIWENVFGQWVNWSERDKSILRAMMPIQRRFVSLFSGEEWIPLMRTENPHVFASQWGTGDLRLWTLVNRSNEPVHGPLLTVDAQPGQQFFDLVVGRQLDDVLSENHGTLSGRIAPRSIGCFLASSPQAQPGDLGSFLTHQREGAGRYSNDSAFLKPEVDRVPVRPTLRFAKPPAGMVSVPGGSFTMTVDFRVREVGFYPAWTGRPITWPWLDEKISFTREVTLRNFAIDETPVTNREFAQFLNASGYRPQLEANFLRHWQNGRIPGGLEEHPVVYVTVDDARAYAAWAGKRLPTEEEWQHAAQGPDTLAYPWGDKDDPARRNGGEKGGSTPVRAHPGGRSTFGAYDMCGNVWELTESEHTDGRNRFLLLKGGCWYRAEGSLWYFDGGPQPNRHLAKQLLFWPGLDRCATVGFRCVVDLG